VNSAKTIDEALAELLLKRLGAQTRSSRQNGEPTPTADVTANGTDHAEKLIGK
jgi:hypothetical protein